MRIFLRKLHRWLGLLIAVQVIAWMSSGFYFALFPIETIRAEHLAAEPTGIEARQVSGLVDPGKAWLAVSEAMGPGATIRSVEIAVVDGVSVYRFEGTDGDGGFSRRVDAVAGSVLPMIDRESAGRIAVASLAMDAPAHDVELVDEAQPGSEFRGRRLPLWRVRFPGPESLNVYVDAWSGEVVARRTQRWRVFDFLWMLHIMDFSERDDFNTPLLQVSALLGLILAVSGLVYWGMTTSLFRRRRAGPRP